MYTLNHNGAITILKECDVPPTIIKDIYNSIVDTKIDICKSKYPSSFLRSLTFHGNFYRTTQADLRYRFWLWIKAFFQVTFSMHDILNCLYNNKKHDLHASICIEYTRGYKSYFTLLPYCYIEYITKLENLGITDVIIYDIIYIPEASKMQSIVKYVIKHSKYDKFDVRKLCAANSYKITAIVEAIDNACVFNLHTTKCVDSQLLYNHIIDIGITEFSIKDFHNILQQLGYILDNDRNIRFHKFR